MSNATVVREMYDAFLRGDIPVLLGHLSESVAWESWDGNNWGQKAGIDYLIERKDVAGVAEFFGIVAESLEPLVFDVKAIVGDGDEVFVRVSSEWRVRSTGTVFADEELHWWVFDASGQVVRFRHYIDTAKHLAANGLS